MLALSAGIRHPIVHRSHIDAWGFRAYLDEFHKGGTHTEDLTEIIERLSYFTQSSVTNCEKSAQNSCLGIS